MVAGSAPRRDGYGPAGRSAWLDVDWREHQRWLTLDGSRVNVIALGDGPPLLLVHGLAGCWQNWLENIPHLARTHRVIVPDLPGFGASEMPRREITMPGYARFLDELCDALGIAGGVALAGNSMGGLIGAELALAAPGRVERLALVSAAGISTERVPRAPILAVARALSLLTAVGRPHMETIARRPRARRAVLAAVCHRADRLPAPLVYQLMQGGGKPGFLAAQGAVLGHPLRARLGQIACPTLIVWGAKDRIVTVRDARRYAELIPHARKVVLPATGHVAMLERPARVNALLDEFLAAPAASPEPEAEAERLSA